MSTDVLDRVRAAQAEIHAAAEAIRALPDAELLALVSVPTAALASPPSARPPVKVPGAGRPSATVETVDDVAKKHAQGPKGPTKYDAAVLMVLGERGPTGPAELARLVGAKHTGAIFHTLKHLLTGQAIVKQGSGGKGATFYAIAPARGARQAGAKPTATPAPAADDEDGPVQAVHAAPPQASARPATIFASAAFIHRGETWAQVRAPLLDRGFTSSVEPIVHAAPALHVAAPLPEVRAETRVAPAAPPQSSAAIHRAPTSLLARPRAAPRTSVPRRADLPIADVIARAAADAGDELVALPDGVGLEVGVGDRRSDCLHFGGPTGCLTRFVKRDVRWCDLSRADRRALRTHEDFSEGDVPGRCPTDCPHYCPPPKGAELAFHMRGGRSPLAIASEHGSRTRATN